MYRLNYFGNNLDMKKIIAFLLLFLPIGFLLKANNYPDFIFDIDGIEKICVVTKDEIKDEQVVETLSYNYVFYSAEQKEKIKKINAEGYVLYLSGVSESKLQNDLKLMILKEEKILDKQVVYGYTPLCNKTIEINNKKINVEMVIDNEKIIIGFPLILSGY